MSSTLHGMLPQEDLSLLPTVSTVISTPLLHDALDPITSPTTSATTMMIMPIILPSGFKIRDAHVWQRIWQESFDRLRQASSLHRKIALIDQDGQPTLSWHDTLDVMTFQSKLTQQSATHQHHPKPPCFSSLIQANNANKRWPTSDIEDVLLKTQKYISQLGYNHLGDAFFDVTKSAGASRIMVLAKDIIHQSLPIKCLEAVVVATYLTMGVHALERIPLAFESHANGNTYRHIVLVVRHRPKPGHSLWGAIGLSRRQTLMWKDCQYEVHPFLFTSTLSHFSST